MIKRNRTITTYYAQLYQNEPNLYKWAGMAAFASFHIGKKLEIWNWKKSGIKSLSATCEKKNRNIEDDFQIIRILNNEIFLEIGSLLLTFSQMDYLSFKVLLKEKEKHQIIIEAFERLNTAKELLKINGCTKSINKLIWVANTEILWHEQSEVVQPFFDKLSDLFSQAMSLFASFDYKINHHKTKWISRSRFIIFMLLRGFNLVKKDRFIPKVTNLQHRWFWIYNDILKKWKKVEADVNLMTSEIEILFTIEERSLKF